MVSIVVRLLDGSNVRYEDVLPDTTVLQFKQRIQERQGILISEQKLLYAGQFLDDQRELDDYNISEGFVIRLVTAVSTPSQTTLASGTGDLPAAGVLRNVFIKPASGPSINIRDVPANSSVERLKQMYSYRTGQEPLNIRFIFGGKELQDNLHGRGNGSLASVLIVEHVDPPISVNGARPLQRPRIDSKGYQRRLLRGTIFR